MLVLTRKVSQSIAIGDDIKITVLSVDGDRISIGIEAPRHIKVFRSELLEETKNLNRESTGMALSELADLKRQIDSKEK